MRITGLPSLLVPSLLVLAALPAPSFASPSPTTLADTVAVLPTPRHATAGHDRGGWTGDLALTGPAGGRKPAFLDADEISSVVAPYAQDIERCFDRTRRAGHLELTLVIGRAGDVVTLRAAAVGLSTEAARKIEACIGVTVAQARFPARRSDTTAVVPYYFQRTAAPNAGPQLSCWNARGC
jgi:hypothetical protein